jgi:hypothetical protein
LSTYETEYGSIHGDDWGSAIDRSTRENAMLRERNLPIPEPKSLLNGSAGTDTEEQETIPKSKPPVQPEDSPEDIED